MRTYGSRRLAGGGERRAAALPAPTASRAWRCHGLFVLWLMALSGARLGAATTSLQSSLLRDKITDYLADKLRAKLARRDELRRELAEQDLPFHRALLGFMPASEVEKALLESKFVASLATSMGSWYEQMAIMIAKDRYGKASKPKITGAICEGTADAIQAIMRDLDNGKGRPDYEAESQRIKEATAHGDASKPRRVSITVDFFIPDADGVVFAAELKTPRPNKSVVKAEKRKLLELRALLFQEHPDRDVRTCFAFPYNPYRTREAFEKHWHFGRKYVDFEHDFLVGKEFWDYVGGEGTYEALLGIAREVGESMQER